MMRNSSTDQVSQKTSFWTNFIRLFNETMENK
jgi:hypothetical protein